MAENIGNIDLNIFVAAAAGEATTAEMCSECGIIRIEDIHICSHTYKYTDIQRFA